MITLALEQAQTLPPTTEELIGTYIIIALAVVLMVALGFMGLFSEKTFSKAPKRHGHMGFTELGLTILFIFFLPVAIFKFAKAMGSDLQLQGPGPDVMLNIMLFTQFCMLLVALFGLIRGHQATEGGLLRFGLGLGKRPLFVVGVMILGGMAVLLLVLGFSVISMIFYQAIGTTPPKIGHGTLQALVDTDEVVVKYLLILSAVVIAPLLEEFVFRGIIQTAMLQSEYFKGRWSIIFLASLLFLVVHMGMDWHALPSIFVLSLGLGYLYERTGSLWPSIFTHVAFNALNITLALNM